MRRTPRRLLQILTIQPVKTIGVRTWGILSQIAVSGRCSALDSRNFYSPERALYQQNQFCGLFGGPLVRNKVLAKQRQRPNMPEWWRVTAAPGAPTRPTRIATSSAG